MADAKYNIPDEKDPLFGKKIADLVRQLFESQDSDTKTFKPISTPDGTKQLGEIWFDSTDGKFKVNTTSGIKTIKYE